MPHRFSICSYSFRRSFENGAMDYPGYVAFHQRHGFTQLDPWMKHLEPALEDKDWLADAGRWRRMPVCLTVASLWMAATSMRRGRQNGRPGG